MNTPSLQLKLRNRNLFFRKSFQITQIRNKPQISLLLHLDTTSRTINPPNTTIQILIMLRKISHNNLAQKLKYDQLQHLPKLHKTLPSRKKWVLQIFQHFHHKKLLQNIKKSQDNQRILLKPPSVWFESYLTNSITKSHKAHTHLLQISSPRGLVPNQTGGGNLRQHLIHFFLRNLST